MMSMQKRPHSEVDHCIQSAIEVGSDVDFHANIIVYLIDKTSWPVNKWLVGFEQALQTSSNISKQI